MILTTCFTLTGYGLSVTQDVNSWLTSLPKLAPEDDDQRKFECDVSMMFGIEEDFVQLVVNCVCNTVMLKLADLVHSQEGPALRPKFLSSTDVANRTHETPEEGAAAVQKICAYTKEHLDKLIRGIQCKTEFVQDQPRLTALVRNRVNVLFTFFITQLSFYYCYCDFSSQALKVAWKRVVGDLKDLFFKGEKKAYTEHDIDVLVTSVKDVRNTFQQLEVDYSVTLTKFSFMDHVVEWHSLTTNDLQGKVCSIPQKFISNPPDYCFSFIRAFKSCHRKMPKLCTSCWSPRHSRTRRSHTLSRNWRAQRGRKTNGPSMRRMSTPPKGAVNRSTCTTMNRHHCKINVGEFE